MKLKMCTRDRIFGKICLKAIISPIFGLQSREGWGEA